MANAAGFIQESIWRDPEWRRLSRSAQALYVQLLSQKELDCAGILPLQPHKWAKGCAELTVEQVLADLDELQSHRFVFHDNDTDEVFIRTYIRNSNVMKVPNMRKSARRSALLVGSSVIKPILAAELVATGDPECVVTAREINPSLTLPEPLPNPSDRNPSGTLPEPTGVGKGVGVTNLGNNSGGVNARPICSKHRNGNPDGDACRGCMRIREWDENHAAAAEADELDAKRRARERADNCPDCHGTNVIEVADNRVRKCFHEAALHA